MDGQSQQPLLLLSLLSLAPLPPISATSHSASAGSAPPAQTLQKQTVEGGPRDHRRSRRPGWGVPPPRVASTSSTEAHELLPPGEILSLEGARVQGARRVGVTVFLASRNGSGRRVYPDSQRDLGELGPGAPQR